MYALARLAVPLLVIAVSIARAEDKKTGDGKGAATSEQDYKQLGKVHEVTGKLLSVRPSDKTLTIEVEYQFLEPKNKNALKKMNAQQQRLYKEQQQLLKDQQKVLTSRNPAQAAKSLHQLQLHSAKLQQNELKANDVFKVSTAHKDFDLQAAEDVKVRIAKLPTELDENGRQRKLTENELKERKGPDANLPGYTSAFEALKPGQHVKVTLGKSGPRDTSKTKDSGDDHPKITMIVITQDTDLAASAKANNKKN